MTDRHFYRSVIGMTAALVVAGILCAIGWLLWLAQAWLRFLFGRG